jgi:hypothetical protein
LRQATWQQAEVLVIGDSFSEPRIWQSVLTQRGLQVRTELWGTVRGVCEDFMPWLRAQGFTGKYVVFERIERSLVSDLPKLLACQKMLTHGGHTSPSVTPPLTTFNSTLARYTGRLSIGIRTQINTLRYERHRQAASIADWVLPNGVQLSRLANGCQLFSHARCQDVLFLSEDRASDIGDDSLQIMAKINARLNGITPIWMVIPNKSTAYLYPNKSFWNRAEPLLNAPNLLRETQRAITQHSLDFYPANDTHFSTTGYLWMGETMLRHLQSPHAAP